MTQAEIEAAIAALERELNTGVSEFAVSPDGATTTRLRSSAEIEQRLATLKGMLGSLTGSTTKTRTVRFAVSSGLM